MGVFYRIISSLLFVPYLAYAIFASSDIPFLILTSSIIILTQLEFYSILDRKGFRTYRYPAILAGVLIVVISGYGFNPDLSLDGLILSLGIILYLAGRSLRGKWIGDLSMSLFGVIYLAWTLVHLVWLRNLVNGSYYLFICFTVTWANDIGAYAVGSLIGRHKIMPKISPAKSIEGAIGGLFGAILTSIICGSYLIKTLSLTQSFTLGLFLGIFGQFGDAVESILKRDLGVKDSGDLVPGHGGVLDVFDSLLFTGPLMFYLIQHSGLF